MPLSRLPDEILELVFLESVLTKQDLCAVALTSRRLSKTVLASLYHDIYVCIPDIEYDYLVRTFAERPDLAVRVRSAVLCDAGEWHYRLDQKKRFNEVNNLLKLLPAVQYLDLRQLPLSYESLSLFDNPLVQVRTVLAYWYLGSPLYDGMKAMLLPRITKLRLDFEYDPDIVELWPKEFQKGTPEMPPQHSSSLKSLLVACWDHDILESDLIKVPCNLETLSALHYLEDIIPDRLMRALRPLYTTLVNLTLRKHPYDLSGLDEVGTIGNFSCFTCLKSLRVDEYLCLEDVRYARFEERCGLFSRLPFTLERLEVSSWGNIGCAEMMVRGRILLTYRSFKLYFDKLEYPEVTDTDDDRQIDPFKDDHPWILELAEQKMTRLPLLSGVYLTVSWDDDQTLRKVPDDLCHAYKSADIDLVLTKERSQWSLTL